MNITPFNFRILVTLSALLTLCGSLAHCQSPLSSHNSSLPEGVLEPWKTSDVACGESGLVHKTFVAPGTRVYVGDPIAELDLVAINLQLQTAIAQSQASGRIETSKVEVSLNERKVAAFSEARGKQNATQMELERAEADLNISKGRLATELEEQQVNRLRVEQLKQAIRQRQINAPINGMVIELFKEVGEYVGPASPEVVRIIDASKLRASFFLADTEIAELPKNGIVKLQLPSGKQIEANVEMIAPIADGESGLIEVRVLVDNPNLEIQGSRCNLLTNPKA